MMLHTRFIRVGAVMMLLLGWLCCLAGLASPALAAAGEPTPQPINPDRLAIPVLPEHPTQEDLGRSVYYYNCMPCHGDVGQGLTDEWRQAWVDDHQNCWERGCHGGRIDDEGFPIPRSVPAVSKAPYALAHFLTPQDLFGYLQKTHPPQRPGVLSEEEYWAVTAFLEAENGHLMAAPSASSFTKPLLGLATIGLSMLTLALLLIRQTRP